MSRLGRLVLCSHGPGDPDLLPVKSVNALATATLALYPESTPAGVIALINPTARREIFPLSSKLLPGERTWADVREELSAGGVVVRIYPDSPQLDPVALREARMMRRDDVDFEVISEPVVGLQAAAYCGVPLDLDRGTVTLVGEQPIAPLGTIISGTAIVMIGRMERPHEAAENLIRAGYSSTTPCLVVHHPTLPTQEVRESMLGNLGTRTDPTTGGVLVAGDAVRQRPAFAWFERLPLFRQRVLVTRASGQANEMSLRLRELGADPIELPTIEFAPPSDTEPIQDALTHISEYDWIIFTSANGVEAFFHYLDAAGRDLRALGNAKVAAIGSATDARLRSHGVKTDYVPERFIAEEVLDGLLERGAGNEHILLPRAEQARDVLPDGLRQAGAEVDVVPVYRTVQAEANPAAMARVRRGDIDVVTLTSSSTARNLATLLDGQMESLNRATVACIGPVTAETATQVGFTVDIVANDYSIPGLLAALVAANERKSR